MFKDGIYEIKVKCSRFYEPQTVYVYACLSDGKIYSYPNGCDNMCDCDECRKCLKDHTTVSDAPNEDIAKQF